MQHLCEALLEVIVLVCLEEVKSQNREENIDSLEIEC